MNQKPPVKTYCGGKPNYVDEPNPPVTTAPKPEWVGLTDEDIFELRRNGAHSVSDIDFRAIEAKLKEKNT
jgi:hypothetical protein